MVGNSEVFLALMLRLAVAAGPAESDFDSAGVRIHYLEAGRGTPVVLIHGYTGNAERHWLNNGIFKRLAEEHRVLAIDCRGHGKSDKPTEPSAYGAEMGRDVIRLLDHLNIRRAHIVGYSMGAMIAGWIVATHPERLLSVTFVAHPAIYEWTDADDREAEKWAHDLESDTPFRAFIVAASPTGAPPSEEKIRELSQRMTAANDTKALAAYHRGLRTLAVPAAALRSARVPALAIIGSADPSLESMRAFAHMMPALRLIVVDGATHGGEDGVLRRSEFLQSLREFLAHPRR